MPTTASLTEADILEKVVANLSSDEARSLLNVRYDQQTLKEIRQLLRKNNRGSITSQERLALEKYLRVGQFLDLLHAKSKESQLQK
ncbi:MAG: hypothetical protein L0215_02280 [Gemmataceae bacterium]|nr:hypothetical protein [Gemmataceae bacterium]